MHINIYSVNIKDPHNDLTQRCYILQRTDKIPQIWEKKKHYKKGMRWTTILTVLEYPEMGLPTNLSYTMLPNQIFLTFYIWVICLKKRFKL